TNIVSYRETLIFQTVRIKALLTIKKIDECLRNALHTLDERKWRVIVVQRQSRIARKWANVVSLKLTSVCLCPRMASGTIIPHACPPLANYVALPARLRGQPDD
ncbi:unnamed protein product, partial [Heterotrigona itama]